MDMLRTQGLDLPVLGLGTYRLTGATGQAVIESALALGYRHLDTAEMYGNEVEVGAALVASGLPRDRVVVTSKVWVDHLAPDAMRRAIEASLRRLKLDQLDLYLIHWPAPGMDLGAVLKSLQTLQDEGWTRAMGTGNFTLALLKRAVEEFNVSLACNQVEYHPYLDQSRMRDWLYRHGIALTAYSPLATGLVNDDPVLVDIAAKHDASPTQVALKWLLDQPGVAVIPKSTRPASQQANLDALKLRLDDDDRLRIAGLRKDRRLINPGFAPAWDTP